MRISPRLILRMRVGSLEPDPTVPQVASHLSLHAADPDQLIENQQGSMDPVIPIHALFLGQGLIKPFLCFFKRVLQRDAECFHYTTPRLTQPNHLCGGF